MIARVAVTLSYKLN